MMTVCCRKFPYVCSLTGDASISGDGLVLSEECEDQVCKVCNKKFANPFALSKHYRVRGADNCYPCDQCDKRFHTARCLSIHKTRMHSTRYTEERMCRVCDEKFASQFLLLEHKRVHDIVSRHECDLCEKWFNSVASLSIHKTRKHSAGKTDSERVCKVCNKAFDYPCQVSAHMVVHDAAVQKPHRCEVCGKSFRTHGYLSLHQNAVHSTTRPHECPLCEKSFKTKCVLDRHRKALHSDEKPHACSVCGFRFALRGALTKHMICHSDEKRYQCTLCCKRFKHRSGLSEHRRQCGTNVERRFACKICDSRFHTGSHLRVHLKTHLTLKPYKCFYCDKCFREQNRLDIHLTVHTGYRPFECKICHRWFRLADDLAKHRSVHTGEKRHRCATCGRAFRLRGTLLRHLLSHSGKKRFECTVCNKRFADRGDLKKHEQAHSETKKYSCATCGKRYSLLRNLKFHVIRHTDPKAFACKVCGKELTTPDNLQTHMLSVHSSVRPYHCQYCGKTFARRRDCIHHSYVHMSSRYCCKHCSSGFKSLSVFRRHLLEQHNEGVWYSCDLCPMKFVFQSSLNSHRRTHDDILPYTCSECLQRFKSRYGFQVHLLKHSGVKRFGCGLCDQMFYLKTDVRRHVKRGLCSAVDSVIKRSPWRPMFTGTSSEDCVQLWILWSSVLREDRCSQARQARTVFGCGFCDQVFSVKSDVHRHVKQGLCSAVDSVIKCSPWRPMFAGTSSKDCVRLWILWSSVLREDRCSQACQARTVFGCGFCDQAFSVKTDVHRLSLIHISEPTRPY